MSEVITDAISELPGESDAILTLIESYVAKEPHSSAQSIEALDRGTAARLLEQLSVPTCQECVRHMNAEVACDLLQLLPEERMQSIAAGFDPDQAADFFVRLPYAMRKPFLRSFTPTKRKHIRDYLSYPEGSAGRIMVREFTAFKESATVGDTIAKIRRMRRAKKPVTYLYVIDAKRRLRGIANIIDLLVTDEAEQLKTVMREEVFSVDCFMDRERVANAVRERGYLMVPVVESDGRLLGVIRAEHLIEDVQLEASEDLQKLFGGGGDETVSSPILFSLRQRLPWLHGNLLTAFLAAAVVGLFEDVIAKITVLAMFLPVVAGQGGNAGAQSLAVVMRGLVMREIPTSRYRSLLFKESVVGLINGAVIGLVTGLIAWVWQSNFYLGVVIGLGMIVNLIVAGFSGAAIPLILKSLGLDPAQSSNIILTTITDVIGFLAFLGFAVLFQSYLLGAG